MTKTINKINMKMKKAWFKLLKASARGNLDKALKLEQKIIKLELELKNI